MVTQQQSSFQARKETGTLYVKVPGASARSMYQELNALYPEPMIYSHEADGICIYALDVPYPVEHRRLRLVRLCYGIGFGANWFWKAPQGMTLSPGGTLVFRCRVCESTPVLQMLERWFPGAYVYTYQIWDGTWVDYEVDAPCPDVAFLQQVRDEASSGSQELAQVSWLPWRTEEVWR